MSISSLDANLITLPLKLSVFFSNHVGIGLFADSSKFIFKVLLSFLFSLTVITSPTFTK